MASSSSSEADPLPLLPLPPPKMCPTDPEHGELNRVTMKCRKCKDGKGARYCSVAECANVCVTKIEEVPYCSRHAGTQMKLCVVCNKTPARSGDERCQLHQGGTMCEYRDCTLSVSRQDPKRCDKHRGLHDDGLAERTEFYASVLAGPSARVSTPP